MHIAGGPFWMLAMNNTQAPSKEKVSEERLRNTRAWAAARLGQMSGAEVIVGAIDELLQMREDWKTICAAADAMPPNAEPQPAASNERVTWEQVKAYLRESHVQRIAMGDEWSYEGNAHAYIEHLEQRVATLQREVAADNELIERQTRLLNGGRLPVRGPITTPEPQPDASKDVLRFTWAWDDGARTWRLSMVEMGDGLLAGYDHLAGYYERRLIEEIERLQRERDQWQDNYQTLLEATVPSVSNERIAELIEYWEGWIPEGDGTPEPINVGKTRLRDTIAALRQLQPTHEPPADAMAPIACIRVGEDDSCEVLKLYAPGLPTGEHDLYPAASSQPPSTAPKFKVGDRVNLTNTGLYGVVKSIGTFHYELEGENGAQLLPGPVYAEYGLSFAPTKEVKS